MSAAARARASASGDPEEVVGQPLGRLRADPGQPVEGLDEARDRLDQRDSPRALAPPEQAAEAAGQATGDRRHLLVGQAAGHVEGVVDAATTRSWSMSTSAGSTAWGRWST